jgi:arabinofuranosyltransferase
MGAGAGELVSEGSTAGSAEPDGADGAPATDGTGAPTAAPAAGGIGSSAGEAKAFAAVCAGSVALSLWSIWRARFTIGGKTAWVLYDDAMISMRYARNLANGDGLVWNAGGERVEGITNPLWAIWMAVLHVLPFGPLKQPVLVMLSSAVLLLAALWVARRLAQELAPDRPAVGVVAAVLTATFAPLVLWSMGGMEVGLLAWLLGAAVLSAVRLVARPEAWARRDTIVTAALAGAAIATRVDAVVGLGAVAAAAVWCATPDQRRRVALVLGAPVLGGLALVTAVRLAYYGDLLPNTYYLKATGVGLDVRLDAGFRHLVVALWAHLAVLTVAATVGALAGRGRAGAPRLVPILVGLALVQVLYSVWVGGDAWESLLIANRYLSVAIVPVAVLAAVGMARLAADPRAFGRFCLVVAAIVGAGVLVARSSFGEGGVTNYSRKILELEAHDQVWLYVVVVLALAGGGLAVGRGALRASPTVLTTAAVVVVVVLTNARPASSWLHHSAFDLEQDLARRGAALSESTAADTEIAVWMAGAEPYFADRPAVDLYGKSDEYIARLPVPEGVLFWPGHVKYDLDWSLDEWAPDLVMLGGSSPNGPEVRATLEDHGYEPLAGDVWLRDGSDRVDPWKLARLLREMRPENAGN